MAHTHSVASQQTHSMWYTRAVSCRKQPEPNSAPHRGTVFIRALLPPCVLKTVSSPYLHKPYNWRLHPTYANTDTLWVCVRESLCEPATAGHSRTTLHFFFFFFLPDGRGKRQRWGRGCSSSTELMFNLQRFIDQQYVLLFAHFIAASRFVADWSLLWMRCCCFPGWPVYVWN